jgi:Fe-S oxidoreductase/nitrate reductase gamma subunit
MYLLFVVSLAVFGWGIRQRLVSLRRGRPDAGRFTEFAKRFGFMLRELLFQRRVRESRIPAVFHSLIFYPFLVLLAVTAVVALDYDFGTSLFQGRFYVLLTVAAEAAGVLVLVGVFMALWRRLVQKPDTLETGFNDLWPLLLLALIVLTGFVVEGLRIHAAGDRWQALSPVGLLLARLFSGVPASAGPGLHATVWWVHAGLVFFWIAMLPYSKFFHLLGLPANAFLAKWKPAGELERTDLDALIESEEFDEDAFTIGIDTPDDLTWKQRLDLDACVSCGRCDEACPALAAGRPLSPRGFIAGMKELVREPDPTDNALDPGPGGREIVGNAFDTGFIWRCLTCMACVRRCPAFIPHVDTLIDVRRNEIGMKGRADKDVSRMVRSLEVQGNPFGSQIKRVEWIRSLGVPVVEAGKEVEVLYWIGCLTTFDEEKQKIAVDLMQVLQQCGADFGVLGKAEACCGDPARVCGAEHLFQTVAKQQVEELNRRSFRTLLVSCPHCLNALKNEYPHFGGRYRVVHHSEYLQELIRTGRLKPSDRGPGVAAYHDPCYLGRYQGIFDPPRQLIQAAYGEPPREMDKCRETSFCCGGGGGHLWMDYGEGERVDVMRIRQVRETKAETLVTSCPFCLHMLQDALKAEKLDGRIRVRDIASLLGPEV